MCLEFVLLGLILLVCPSSYDCAFWPDSPPFQSWSDGCECSNLAGKYFFLLAPPSNAQLSYSDGNLGEGIAGLLKYQLLSVTQEYLIHRWQCSGICSSEVGHECGSLKLAK